MLATLLQHDSNAVRLAVMTLISDLLHQYKLKQEREAVETILSHVLWVDNNCGGYWRVQEQLLLQCIKLCRFLDADEVMSRLRLQILCLLGRPVSGLICMRLLRQDDMPPCISRACDMDVDTAGAQPLNSLPDPSSALAIALQARSHHDLSAVKPSSGWPDVNGLVTTHRGNVELFNIGRQMVEAGKRIMDIGSAGSNAPSEPAAHTAPLHGANLQGASAPSNAHGRQHVRSTGSLPGAALPQAQAARGFQSSYRDSHSQPAAMPLGLTENDSEDDEAIGSSHG